jgi:hypothetical protein
MSPFGGKAKQTTAIDAKRRNKQSILTHTAGVRGEADVVC